MTPGGSYNLALFVYACDVKGSYLLASVNALMLALLQGWVCNAMLHNKVCQLQGELCSLCAKGDEISCLAM